MVMMTLRKKRSTKIVQKNWVHDIILSFLMNQNTPDYKYFLHLSQKIIVRNLQAMSTVVTRSILSLKYRFPSTSTLVRLWRI